MSEHIDSQTQTAKAQTQAENRFVAMVSLAICIFVIYFALGLPISTAWNIVRIRDLELNGQTIKASVGEYHECPAKKGKVVCHDVSYTVQGKQYQNRNARKDLKPGQKIQLIYAPIDPGFYRFADLPKPAPWKDGLGQRLVIVGGISILFLSASLAVLKKQLTVLKALKDSATLER